MTDLPDRTATSLVSDIAAGRLAPSDLMAATLDRIDALNPRLNAIVALRDRDDLMREARALDGATPTGPLFGLPFAIKDVHPTRGLRTTWGSPLFADHVPEADDLLAARIRAAGAILIGKTNTPEFALGSNTFNPVYGQTLSPFDDTRTPGGSSGGAAVALATGMLTIADGSDMMGSLRNPAAWCNVWSLRPTMGLVPKADTADPILARLSTDGPMARRAGDLTLLLDVLAAPHATWPMRPHRDPAAPDSLNGLRLGWLADWSGTIPFDDDLLAHCETALAAMEQAGARVTPLPAPFPEPQMWAAWETLRAWSVYLEHRADYDIPEKAAQMKASAVWEIERGARVSANDIAAASNARAVLTRALLTLLETHDALVLPSTQAWPFPITQEYLPEIAGVAMPTYHRWMEIVVPVSLTGLPAAGIPGGFDARGLPFGLQLIGPPGSDDRLIGIAKAWEAAAGDRLTPPRNLRAR